MRRLQLALCGGGSGAGAGGAAWWCIYIGLAEGGGLAASIYIYIEECMRSNCTIKPNLEECITAIRGMT